MSRIRSTKPDYWSSEQVMAVSREARLLFLGIWNFADDAGRFPWKPGTLKAQILPGDDDVNALQVSAWLAELSGVGLVQPYSVLGKDYGRVTGWRHQQIKTPSLPKYPPPPDYQETAPGLPQDCPRAGEAPDHGSSGILSSPLGTTPLGESASAPPEVELTQVGLAPAPASDRTERRLEVAAPKVATTGLAHSLFEEYRAASFARDLTPESAGADQKLRIAQRICDHASLRQVTLKAACDAILRQAFDDAAATDRKVVLALERCEPGKPAPPRGKPLNAPPDRELSKPAQEAAALSKKLRDEKVFF